MFAAKGAVGAHICVGPVFRKLYAKALNFQGDVEFGFIVGAGALLSSLIPSRWASWEWSTALKVTSLPCFPMLY